MRELGECMKFSKNVNKEELFLIPFFAVMNYLRIGPYKGKRCPEGLIIVAWKPKQHNAGMDCEISDCVTTW